MEPTPWQDRVSKNQSLGPPPEDKRFEKKATAVMLGLLVIFIFGVWQYNKPKPAPPPTPYILGWNEGLSFGRLSAKAGHPIPRKVELDQIAQDHFRESVQIDPTYKSGFVDGFKQGYIELTERAW